MDVTEATRNVLERIRNIEPENASKIMGFLLLKDNCEREMIRLSFGPDKLIEDVVKEAKLGLESMSQVSALPSPATSRALMSELPLHLPRFPPAIARAYPFSAAALASSAASYWNTQVPADPLNSDYPSLGYVDSVLDRLRSHHLQLLNPADQIGSVSDGIRGYPADYHSPETSMGGLNLRTTRRSPSAVKLCDYFNRGHCKHGSSCRYLHGHSIMDNVYQRFGPNSNEFGVEDHLFSRGPLEKLELEIAEILKSKRGNPVSIASLPMMYFENYGKTLQAEGYLTESQRHGRAGCSLTKLLSRLRSIRLIDRPHGQHSVILAEDAAKYNLENHNERKDPGPVVNGSRQIYLTFPAESTFTDDDVKEYFSSFGKVDDVRIPCQQKRMFGFVTFTSADTATAVLAMGNPHFVRGARVLVKQYREKSKLVDRKCLEKNEHPCRGWESDHDYHLVPRGWEAPRLWRRHLMEQQEAVEYRRSQLQELQLRRKAVVSQPYMSYSMEELNAIGDPSGYTDLNELVMNMLSNSSINDRSGDPTASYSDQASQGINPAESTLASPIAQGISTVT